MPLRPQIRRAATATAFRVLGETRFDDLRAAHVARKIRTGRYRTAEIDLLPHLLGPGATAIDVGANLGLYAYHLALLTGDSGRVYALEAVPGTCRALRRVLATLGVAGRVEVIEKAAGAERGSVRFDVPRRPDGSADIGRAATLPSANGDATGAITLPLTRLDEEVAPDADVSFVKLDIEGAELFALRGAEGIIARSHPTLLIEIAPKLLDRHGLSGADVGAFLDEHGYATYRYDATPARLTPVSAGDMIGDLVAVHPQRGAAVERLLGA